MSDRKFTILGVLALVALIVLPILALAAGNDGYNLIAFVIIFAWIANWRLISHLIKQIT